MTRRVTVVGAGVIGLSAAVRLAESGLDVDVLARELPAETTSAASGGLWLPDDDAPEDVVRRAAVTLAEFVRLAERPGGEGATGVRLRPGTVLHRRSVPLPGWLPAVTGQVAVQPVHAPAPGFGSGHRMTVPLVHVPRYLAHLVERLRAAGGTLTRLPLAALPERGVVVNCTGTAARALAPDPLVRPVRGQVVLVSDPGLPEWWYAHDESRPLYVLPRGADVVVGGTRDDGDWNPTPDPAVGAQLLERATALVPELRGSRVIGHRVGLRPARPTVRVELERRPTDDDPGHVRVHCYGTGGSGVTQSWGCAEEVLSLVRSVTAEPALQD